MDVAALIIAFCVRVFAMRSIRLQTFENRLKSNFIARPTVQLMACATFRLVYKPTCWRQTTTAVVIPLEFGTMLLSLSGLCAS